MKEGDEHLINTSLIRAPFIDNKTIQRHADNFRCSYWKKKPLPVDILGIIEFELKLDFEPIKNLRLHTGCDALLSWDCKTITIDWDEFQDERHENRLRFSCAHEIGHLILHKDLYRQLRFSTVDEWIDLMQKIPEREYSFIEFHANEFAGRLLVPRDALLTSIAGCKDKVKEALKIDKNMDPLMLKEYISSSICKGFGVSAEVISRRIEREQINILKI